MARKKDNIVYHNMRMNLDNEQHRRIHRVLTDLNTDVHKSVNQFLIDATDAYIRALEGNDLTTGEMAKTEAQAQPYVTREDLDRVQSQIRDELQREMIGILVSSLIAGKVIQVPEIRTVREEAAQNVAEDDPGADETTIGLASSWG